MALRGHVFDKQLFSSDCYALVTDTFLNKNSGIIKGCELTNTASSIYIDNGYFVVKGRPIQEEGGTTIEVEPGSLEGIYCKLVCEIDMSQTNTTTSLNQVSYKILEDTADYPTLVLEDITDGGTIYQFELAKFRRTLNGIEDFVDTRSFLNFDSIYDFVKNEIKKIEEGSLFITEEEFEEEMLNSGVVVSPTEPTGNDRKKVWIQKGKNSFNVNVAQNNIGVNATFNGSKLSLNGTSTKEGDIVANTFLGKFKKGTYKVSFEKESGNQTTNGGAYTIYLKKPDGTHMTFLELSVVQRDDKTITLNEDTDVYLSIYANKAGIVLSEMTFHFQLEQGSVATDYEAYIEPKIYVLNDNDTYEEFAKKEQIVETDISLTATSSAINIIRAKIRKYGNIHHIDIACAVLPGQNTIFNTQLKPAFVTELNLATNSNMTGRCVINTNGSIEVANISAEIETAYINGIVII